MCVGNIWIINTDIKLSKSILLHYHNIGWKEDSLDESEIEAKNDDVYSFTAVTDLELGLGWICIWIYIHFSFPRG